MSRGSVLIVDSIQRVASNTKELIEFTKKLDEKGIRFMTVKENINSILPIGKTVILMLRLLANLEKQIFTPEKRVSEDTWE